MANLPLAFGEMLAGGVLLSAGISGASIADVFAGNLSLKGLDTGTGGTGAAGSTAGAVAAGTGQPTPVSDPAGVTKRTGLVTFDGKQVAAWIAPILSYGRAHGWRGTVSSGYRSAAEQAAIYNSGVRPAAPPGHSNHQGKAFPAGAVDVTDAAGLSAALQNSPFAHLLIWAGSKDPVHFSFPHGGGY